MIRDSGQFGSFDGRDNRRAVMDCFVRMGHGLSEFDAACRRARFLRRLVGQSAQGWSQLPAAITPCSAAEAYHLFVAITGVLGVPIDRAAMILEQEVRRP